MELYKINKILTVTSGILFTLCILFIILAIDSDGKFYSGNIPEGSNCDYEIHRCTTGRHCYIVTRNAKRYSYAVTIRNQTVADFGNRCDLNYGGLQCHSWQIIERLTDDPGTDRDRRKVIVHTLCNQ